MSLLSKMTRSSRDVELDAERPELWVPPTLAEHYPGALETIRQSTSSRDGLWFENFRSRLLHHVAYVLSQQHDGIIPGTVQKPLVSVRRRWQQTGTPMLYELVAEGELTPEEEAAWGRYFESEALREEFEQQVNDLAGVIADDPARSFALHQHMLALDLAAERNERVKQEAQDERRRLQRDRCPVCLESDRDTIGAVQSRVILAGDEHRRHMPAHTREATTLTSCAACWAVASQHLTTVLAEQAVSVGRSRRDVVLRELGWGD